MLKKIFIMAVLILLCVFTFVGCSGEDDGKKVYSIQIHYDSLENINECTVSGITIKADKGASVDLEIPAVSPDGKKVVGIGTLTNGEQYAVPRVLLREDFEEIIQKIANYFGLGEDEVSENFFVQQFCSYYYRKSSQDALNSTIREDMLKKFPYVKYADCWIFDTSADLAEIEYVSSFLQKIGYTYEDCCEDYTNLINKIQEKAGTYTTVTADILNPNNYNYSVVKSVKISEGIQYIDDYAFGGFYQLCEINIPDSVTTIGNEAFSSCDKLIQADSGVFYIDKWAVGCDEDVKNIVLRSDTKGIADAAFENCSNVKSITLSDGLKTIGDNVFRGCGIKEIIIPAGVKAIGECAFKGSKLQKINLPDSVTTIGREAFFGCTRLKSISIPAELESVGDDAFGGDITIDEIYVTDIMTWCQKRTLLTVPGMEKRLYINDDLVTELVIPKEMSAIDAKTFEGIVGINSISMSGVTAIGERAFYGCTGLRSVTLPDSITSIDSYAFGNCTGLKTLVVPFVTDSSNGKEVNLNINYAFAQGSSIETVVIKGGTSIGARTFRNWSGLTSITISDSVTAIGENAFENCKKLESIEFMGSVEAWKALAASSGTVNYWAENTGNYVVYCTDGEVSKSGVITMY